MTKDNDLRAVLVSTEHIGETEAKQDLPWTVVEHIGIKDGKLDQRIELAKEGFQIYRQALVPEVEARELWEVKYWYDNRYTLIEPERHAAADRCIKLMGDENAQLKKKIESLEEKCQDYLDATGDAVSTLCLRDEKIARLRKALEVYASQENWFETCFEVAKPCQAWAIDNEPWLIAKEALEGKE